MEFSSPANPIPKEGAAQSHLSPPSSGFGLPVPGFLAKVPIQCGGLSAAQTPVRPLELFMHFLLWDGD